MQQQRTDRSNFEVEAEAVIKKVDEDILSVGPDLEYTARYDLRLSLPLSREQYLTLKRAEREGETFAITVSRLQQEMDLSGSFPDSPPGPQRQDPGRPAPAPPCLPQGVSGPGGAGRKRPRPRTLAESHSTSGRPARRA